MEVILQDAAYEGGGRVSHTHEDREKYYTVIFLDNIQEGLPWGFSGKESSCNARDASLILVLGRLENTENGNLVFLPGKLLGQRSLLGYSAWGCKSWT